ncbi:MAG: hypothetical protein WCV90_05355 [Candidatus Woesearchaeota archaeon]|jgi:hypothetical protein
MTYLASYASLWDQVASNDGRNSPLAKLPRAREGDLELAVRGTFNGITAMFRFHELSEKDYLRSLEDPSLKEVLTHYGFEAGCVQEKVSEFREYSTGRKIMNNVLSRLLVGPLFFGIQGVYSLKMVHPTADEIKKANEELKGRFREASRRAGSLQNIKALQTEYLENIRLVPKVVSCWERKLLSGRPYAELGVIGLATTEANHLFRTYIDVVDRLRT